MLYVYWLTSLVISIITTVYVYKLQTRKLVTKALNIRKHVNAKNQKLQSYQTELISSLQYAKEIQKAILPLAEYVLRYLPLSFIYYKPKELVGGDFFWFHHIDDDTYILVCADCTGHGIPGAFMTMLGNSFLNQIVIEQQVYDLPRILHGLDDKIKSTLRQHKSGQIQDGMDMSIIKINKRTRELHFASAKHRIVLFKQGQCHELRGDRFSLGGNTEKKFTETRYIVNEEDTLYMYTDGYVDQFGGPDDKKFSTKKLQELLQTIQHHTMHDQYKIITKTMHEWKQVREQIDDITVIGIKF